MPSIRSFIEPKARQAYRTALPQIRREEVAKRPWDSHDDTFGVAGNTLRAYVGWQRSPGETFRGWARQQTERMVLRTDPKSIASQEGFDRWHNKLAHSLQQAWEAAEGKGLSVSHKYKLIDLYVKWLTRHRLPDSAFRKNLVKFGHCALDRQTLTKINDHLSGALPLDNPRMGIIARDATYDLCQAVIREYCSIVGGSPVLFDYFAWRRGG